MCARHGRDHLGMAQGIVPCIIEVCLAARINRLVRTADCFACVAVAHPIAARCIHAGRANDFQGLMPHLEMRG